MGALLTDVKVEKGVWQSDKLQVLVAGALVRVRSVGRDW